LSFLYGDSLPLDNIHDYYSITSKLIGTLYQLFAFGSSAWFVKFIRGVPVGFYQLFGIIVPNIDNEGKFKPGEHKFSQYYKDSNGDWQQRKFKNTKGFIYFSMPAYATLLSQSMFLPLLNSDIPGDLMASTAYYSMFGNIDAPMYGYWEIDPNIDPDDYKEFKSLLGSRYTGAKNIGRTPIILRGSADFKEFKNDFWQQMPFKESREFALNNISSIAGQPPTVLGAVDTMNVDTLRELNKSYFMTRILPVYKMMEQVIYSQLFVRILNTPAYTIKFTTPSFMSDIEKATYYSKLLDRGVYSPNDVRGKLGEEPRTDPEGDIYYVMKSMVDQGGRPEGATTDKSKVTK